MTEEQRAAAVLEGFKVAAQGQPPKAVWCALVTALTHMIATAAANPQIAERTADNVARDIKQLLKRNSKDAGKSVFRGER